MSAVERTLKRHLAVYRIRVSYVKKLIGRLVQCSYLLTETAVIKT